MLIKNSGHRSAEATSQDPTKHWGLPSAASQKLKRDSAKLISRPLHEYRS